MRNHSACLKVPMSAFYSLDVARRDRLIVYRRRHCSPERSAPGEMFQYALRRDYIVLGNSIDQFV